MNALEPGRFSPLDGGTRLLPVFPGRLRVIGAAASLMCWFGKNEREVSLWPGARFSVDLRDRIQRQMWRAIYEPHVTHCLKSILRPGDTFLDVGAHIGYHSFYAAGVVGKTGRVFSFEPDPSVFARLKRNLRPFPCADPFHCAVWERDAPMTFERSSCAAESGWGTLTSVRDTGRGEHVQVQAVSLDNWNGQVQLSSLRAIKMDAEGSELAILQGAKNLLAEFRPALILEINDVLLRQSGASAEEIVAELHRHGYRAYDVSFKRLRRRETFPEFTFADCLCLAEESAEQRLSVLKDYGFQI